MIVWFVLNFIFLFLSVDGYVRFLAFRIVCYFYGLFSCYIVIVCWSCVCVLMYRVVLLIFKWFCNAAMNLLSELSRLRSAVLFFRSR